MNWERLADDSTIEKTAKALRERGIEVIVAKDRNEAKTKALELIPQGSEVLMSSSATIKETGIAEELESDKYNEIGKKARSIADAKERNEMRKKSLAPDYVVGSVHAVTEDGQIMVASASGSQIPPYSFGANHVIWVVGTQKIVKDRDSGFKRIYEHSLKLESERVKKAYGWEGSSVNKILIMEKEFSKDRIKLIFVKEKLGF